MEGMVCFLADPDGSGASTLPELRMEPSKPLAAPIPMRVISRKSGLAALDLGQIWEYRDLLSTLSVRDVQLRYRQTALGAIWVLLQPLIAAVIFTFVFNKIAGLTIPGVPPILFTFTGMLAWGAFSGFLGKSSGIIVGNMNLVTKVYFPRLILPLSGILSTLIDFGVGFLVLLVMMVAFHYPPSPAIVLLPFVLLAIIGLALGISLFAAALMVKYRDVGYIIPVFTNMLLFLSPVGYALSQVGQKIPAAAQGFYALNPLVGLLELTRWSVLGTVFPGIGLVLYSLGFTVVVLVGGTLYFKTQERGFADVI